jgi:N-carbamoylputrescine amidase
MIPTPCTVGLIQMRCGEDPDANVAKALERIREAARRGANVIVTQELFRTPYFCQRQDIANFDLAEPIPGPTTGALQALAEELGVVIVGSLFERRAEGLYHNSAVVIDADGTLLGIYRKMHIPDDDQYFEKFYFTPGDTGFCAWKTRHGVIGVLICWDQWYPEAARLTAMAGAQVIVCPTAIGWHDEDPRDVQLAMSDAWETVQRSHAITNSVYLCAVNRVGREGTVEHFGQSFAAAPDGCVLHRASPSEEEIVVAELDLAKIESTRRQWTFLRDRRIDAYGDLTQRFLR